MVNGKIYTVINVEYGKWKFTKWNTLKIVFNENGIKIFILNRISFPIIKNII
jgi:hypothetical protein